MSKELTVEEVLSNLSGESFDAAINNPDDYIRVLQEAEQKALAAINRIRVQDRLKETLMVVSGTMNKSYEEYLLQRIDELQNQLTNPEEDK